MRIGRARWGGGWCLVCQMGLAALVVVTGADESHAQVCAYVASGDRIYVVNTEANAVAHVLALPFRALDVLVTPDGTQLYIGRAGAVRTTGGPVVIATALDLRAGTTTDIEDECPVDDVSSQCFTTRLAIHPSGTAVVAVGSEDQCNCVIGEPALPGEGCEVAQRSSIIDTRTNTLRRLFTLGFGPIGGFLSPGTCSAPILSVDVEVDPGGRSAYVTEGARDVFDSGGNVTILDLFTLQQRTIAGGDCVECEPNLANPTAVTIPPESDFVHVVNSPFFTDAFVAFVDRDDDTVSASTVALSNLPAVAAAVEPSAARLLFVAQGRPLSTDPSGRLTVFDTQTSSVAADLALDAAPSDIAFTPDGARAYLPSHAAERWQLLAIDAESVSVETAIPLPNAVTVASVAIGAVPGGCRVPPTPTPSPTPVPTPGPCFGDCNGNGGVSLAELVRGVSIALGQRAVDDCGDFDGNADGRLEIDELVKGVTASVLTCRGPCFGDCDGDGSVSPDDLVRGVLVALGRRSLDACAGLDADGNGALSIDELALAVRASLAGCAGGGGAIGN